MDFSREQTCSRCWRVETQQIVRHYLTIVVLLIIAGCSDVRDGKTSYTIQTPEGSITAHKSTVEPAPQKITVVSGNELKRLQSLDRRGPAFVATYLPDSREPDLKDYDRAFRAWQISNTPQHSKEQVVEILGGYLGNKCVADFDMEWVSVTDEFGTDFAVRSKSVELMAFPFSTVLKRIEDNEFDFLHGVYHTIKHTLESGDYKSRDPE
jgi:hypothetical protein